MFRYFTNTLLIIDSVTFFRVKKVKYKLGRNCSKLPIQKKKHILKDYILKNYIRMTTKKTHELRF